MGFEALNREYGIITTHTAGFVLYPLCDKHLNECILCNSLYSVSVLKCIYNIYMCIFCSQAEKLYRLIICFLYCSPKFITSFFSHYMD